MSSDQPPAGSQHSSASPKVPRGPTARYGIAEWYGRDITGLTSEERQAFGLLAVRQDDDAKAVGAAEVPLCPFLSNLLPGSRCNKSGGVCSIRKFRVGDHLAGRPHKAGITVPGDKIATVCPNRFLQAVADDKSLFVWIAENMVDVSNPTIVKETPFLRKVSDVARPQEIAQDLALEAEEEKKAGRIDWIVVDPASLNSQDLRWCAVETQALYFSGRSMRFEFDAYASAPSPVLFPVQQRRPDYRSSGPKRLSPQLDVKVPVLRSWGKKVVVVIDQYFHENMNTLLDAYPRARDNLERRDNAEVVWFVVKFDDHLRLRAHTVIYTTLDSSRRALNATEPLSKGQFTDNLKGVIADPARANKVFRASE